MNFDSIQFPSKNLTSLESKAGISFIGYFGTFGIEVIFLLFLQENAFQAQIYRGGSSKLASVVLGDFHLQVFG